MKHFNMFVIELPIVLPIVLLIVLPSVLPIGTCYLVPRGFVLKNILFPKKVLPRRCLSKRFCHTKKRTFSKKNCREGANLRVVVYHDHDLDHDLDNDLDHDKQHSFS